WTPHKIAAVIVAESAAQKPASQNSTSEAPRPLLDTSPSTPLDTRYPTLFNWSQLESADYRVYLGNLRAAGCPEATVRDIIIPDVNEVFYQRVKELVDTVQNRFWDLLADQNAFEKIVDEKHKELDELEKERDNVLQELLGRRANHRIQRDELAQVERVEQ